MIFNYIGLNRVTEKINRIPIFANNYNPEELKEWAVEALLKIGVTNNMDHIAKQIEILDGRGELPDGLEYIDSVLEGESGYPMELIPSNQDYQTLTYKINNGYIFTSFEEGSVIINYYGLLMNRDELLVPDTTYFIAAIEAYLKFKIGEKLFWMQKIVMGQYQLLEREWLFYCNSAKNESKELNNDGLHNFKRSFLQMFPNINSRKTKYTPNSNFNVVNRTILKA